ncbi:iron uptake transporter permease EfeU [Streptomyces beihaiensis]|uniref:FTR1 family protein n=1 Tax=Streptomyces beihaiensis TaxID=2984495 RepID=A0ABT3TVJ6_9ACTN|nr:iron uptake transporter permease EfeU [Streptomyces beihaiensis]MCX3061061.1 FTR1 family protein [Streptomyces beihaiensis]
MTWAEAVPNLLIGLREGLEAGLVVTILLAAVRRTRTDDGRRVPSTPVWLGVLGAVMVAGSFAAVLTFSTDVLSSAGQELVGGLLSLLAVGLVTAMVFWMKRTAASLSKHLRGEVARAASIGAGALAVTAFFAIGREGLETTLFLWTAVRASGSTVAPLVGAGLGLGAAAVICMLLYRQAVRLNLGVFFGRTALALVVIAAGVLSYGLGDLQDAGALPGVHWVAFDLTSHIDPNAWWVSIITGVTELAPRMTVLQVVAWAVYLAVVVPAFLLAGRPTPAAVKPAAVKPAAGEPAGGEPAAVKPSDGESAAVKPEPQAPAEAPAEAPGGSRWEKVLGRRPVLVGAALIAVPALAAGTTIALLPSDGTSAAQTVTVTKDSCAKDWSSAHAGRQTIAVDNRSGKAGEVRLVNSAGAIVAEIETIGPATTADMSATLGKGTYTVHCLMSGRPETSSAAVRVTGGTAHAPSAAVRPVTVKELTGPNDAYRRYAAGVLARLSDAVSDLRNDLKGGRLDAAKKDWLTAQLDWERVGASYNSFGDAGSAVDGLPDGLAGGVKDKHFTGLHRIEYGLWHGQSADELEPVADRLAKDVTAVRDHLGDDDLAGDPTNLPLRAHEILEDALRDHLSGIDDQGSGATYPEILADVRATRAVLGELDGPVRARDPKLLPVVDRELTTLRTSLLATKTGDGRWPPPARTPLAARESVQAALGAVLEHLDEIPNLLEVPPGH